MGTGSRRTKPCPWGGLKDDAKRLPQGGRGQGGERDQSHVCSQGTKRDRAYVTLPFIAELPSFSGAYEKPSLSSLAGTVVAPGENVKLQCFSKINYDVFILTKEGEDHITQNQSSMPQDRGRQTIFLLNPVSSTQAGTYRCYGAFRENPYLWSQPSDPLQLQVEGEEEAQSTRLTPALGADSVRLKHWLGKGTAEAGCVSAIGLDTHL